LAVLMMTRMTERLPLGSSCSFITLYRNLIFFLLSSGADPTKFDSSTLVNLPNIDKGFWECKMDAVSVNGRDLKLADRTNILDTGGLSAFLFLPKSIK
jgi:hypothetical protein